MRARKNQIKILGKGLIYLIFITVLFPLLSCMKNIVETPSLSKGSETASNIVKRGPLNIVFLPEIYKKKQIDSISTLLDSSFHEALFLYRGSNKYDKPINVIIGAYNSTYEDFTKQIDSSAKWIPERQVLISQANISPLVARGLFFDFLFREDFGILVPKICNNPNYKWSEFETEHFKIKYLANKWSADKIDSVGINFEIYYRNNLKILGDTTFNNKVNAFFVGPKSDVGALAGPPVTAITLMQERAMLFSNIKRSTYPSIMQHELMHVLSWQIWGTPKDHFLVEGLATYAYGVSMCNYDFHSLTSYLLNIGKLPSLHDFIYKYDSFDELTKYFAGASFLKEAEQLYGPQALRKLWEQGIEKGLVELGTNVSDFDNKWRNDIKQIKPITEQDWNFIDNGCSDSANAGI